MLAAQEIQNIALQIREAQIEVRQIEPITSRIPAFDLTSLSKNGFLTTLLFILDMFT